jgi:hypothetical protein
MIAALGAVVLVAVFAVLRRPAAPAAIWFDPAWKARQRIDLRGSKLSRPAYDVPILIERGAADAAFWDTVRSNGEDIRFTDAAGAILPYELERFDAAARRMSAWVRVPVVPARSDGTMFLYYGNPSASAGEHPQAVWDSHYLGVWHFTPTKGSATLQFADSTPHRSDAVTGPTPPAVIEARIGSGVRFEANGATLLVPASESWQLSTEPWTIEFWVKPAAPNKRVLGLLQRGGGDLFSLMIHSYGFLYLERRNGDRIANGRYPLAILPDNEWTHVAVRRQNGLVAASFNGEFAPANEEPPSFSDAALPGLLRIGANTYGPFDGALDELRISQGAPRASEWLRAVYYAQRGELARFAGEERR